MLQQIAAEIQHAKVDREKTAMIHFQILLNSEQLEGMDAVAFCSAVGIEDVWAAEFRKMVRLGRFMRDRGYSVTRA